jgi:hypothetical protein
MPLNIEKLNGSTNGKTKPNGFTPNSQNKAKRAAASVQPEPIAAPSASTADYSQVTQSQALTVRESVNMTAGTGAKALQSLTAQRDMTQEAIASEIERLTDPDLFFAETMALAAQKIRTRDQQRDQAAFELDFFDAASVTASLPKPRHLPQATQHKQLSSAG